MDIEQYKGLFYLAAGLSFFVIMFFVLRFFGRKGNMSDWPDIEELEVVEVATETHNIKSFKLKRVNGLNFPMFKGGQFISFQIADDSKITRSYSISSSEKNNKIVQVSVKCIPEGVGSRWFHGLKVGDRVKAYAPSGHFFDDGEGEQDRVLVAGGIGITPVLSILLSNLDKERPNKMHLFYGVRSQKDLAFHKILESLSEVHDSFSYYPILSNDDSWSGDRGYLNIDFIKAKLGSVKEQKFYFCGPEVMTNPIVEALDSMGVAEDNLFSEKFIVLSSLDENSLPERELKVSFSGQTFEYKGRQDLLSFLESKEQSIPFACRSGVCGSCKCKISGQYKMLTKDGLSRMEQKQGYALACVSFPEGDVEVEL